MHATVIPTIRWIVIILAKPRPRWGGYNRRGGGSGWGGGAWGRRNNNNNNGGFARGGRWRFGGRNNNNRWGRGRGRVNGNRFNNRHSCASGFVTSDPSCGTGTVPVQFRYSFDEQ